METTFIELKCKQVINVVDGKTLGRIVDIVIDIKSCKVLGLIVPSPTSGWLSCFKSGKEIFIPFDCICKIGIDVILVELYINNSHLKSPPDEQKSKPPCNPSQCDKKPH